MPVVAEIRTLFSGFLFRFLFFFLLAAWKELQNTPWFKFSPHMNIVWTKNTKLSLYDHVNVLTLSLTKCFETYHFMENDCIDGINNNDYSYIQRWAQGKKKKPEVKILGDYC